MYDACYDYGNGFVHILAFVATVTEIRRQLVYASFIVSLLRTHTSCSLNKTVLYVLGTVAWVATCSVQKLVTVGF